MLVLGVILTPGILLLALIPQVSAMAMELDYLIFVSTTISLSPTHGFNTNLSIKLLGFEMETV